MTKLLSSLIVAAFALTAVGAQAASHAGAAPMKASEAKPAASAAKKSVKKADKKAEKKEEAKK